MANIHIRICTECAQKLLLGNPFVDDAGNTIPFKGIRINRVERAYCELHDHKESPLNKIQLEKVLCRHCAKEFYMIPNDKHVCPSCRSTYMSKI